MGLAHLIPGKQNKAGSETLPRAKTDPISKRFRDLINARRFMTVFTRGSSSVTRLEEHVCFKAKYCHRVFDYPAFRARCEEIFREVAEKHGVVIHEMGFDGDHVHMDWQIRPVDSLSGLAKAFKGTSGRKLLREFPQFKREFFWGSGLWSGVIFGDTVGKDPGQIRAYVRNQGKRAKLLPGQRSIGGFLEASN